MTAGIKPLAKRRAWKALRAHYKKVRELHLRKLFADDPKRGERWYTCVRNCRQSPLPPLSKGGARSAGDLRQQHLCTNLVQFDLDNEQTQLHEQSALKRKYSCNSQ